ncbi:uncharacterized protein LOC112093190, partial [Morus notabilis]|uniref:uncharacterized protein LOC112093190 n=1 Tax=Morus notabilis TaxID=981085 RepID=UPI000CED480C
FGSCNLRILSPISKNPNLFSHKWISTSSSQHSFAVSYLINSLGFSPESAFSSSKYVNFKSPEKPDKVINLFKKYGFTQIQISSLCRRKPILLSLDAEDIILPKLEFFEAKGFSGPEIAKMAYVFPNILASSLTNQIMPSYDLIRNLFQSEEKVVVTVKRFPNILTHNIEKYVVPNVDILREHGVPEFRIARLMQDYAGCFITTPHYFRKAVEKAVEMRFNASNVNFVLAENVLRWLSKSKWKSKSGG